MHQWPRGFAWVDERAQLTGLPSAHSLAPPWPAPTGSAPFLALARSFPTPHCKPRQRYGRTLRNIPTTSAQVPHLFFPHRRLQFYTATSRPSLSANGFPIRQSHSMAIHYTRDLPLSTNPATEAVPYHVPCQLDTPLARSPLALFVLDESRARRAWDGVPGQWGIYGSRPLLLA